MLTSVKPQPGLALADHVSKISNIQISWAGFGLPKPVARFSEAFGTLDAQLLGV